MNPKLQFSGLLASSVDSSLCSNNGYLTDVLSCSACKTLSSAGLSILENECNECCTQDTQAASESNSKYPFAELVVCS
ncbi:hypothetical protein EB796_003685 [Bugula neritina]|uniref:15 kDa selenoprotein n=1 Tax=Bugula neritina TaxID=10212 RepID=A0A7J7KIC4_BUGNE|nr:hypothetical protein EB796_023927 [Bugula neritina]KAF6038005.1 hypothetical protein EB796_003685 [Bugula neritina]